MGLPLPWMPPSAKLPVGPPQGVCAKSLSGRATPSINPDDRLRALHCPRASTFRKLKLRQRTFTRPASELRVDRQQFQQKGDESPSKAGFGLVPVAYPLTAAFRLPHYLTFRVEEDSIAICRSHASRHVGR